MTTDKKIYKEFDAKKKEVADLRTELNELDSHKEKWFIEKEKVHKEISVIIDSAKELKKERNALTDQVKKEKEKRRKKEKEKEKDRGRKR